MEEELNMGLFGEGSELNFDMNYSYDNESDENNDENNDDNENTTPDIEDVNPEEVDEGEDVENEGGDSSESSSNLFSSLAAFAKEQGILPSYNVEEDNILTPEDFANVFKKELEIQTQSKVEDYLNNLDLEKIATVKKEIQNLNQITEETLQNDLTLAKNIIYEDYLNQGLDEKKAKRMLTRLIDLGEDAILEDANESLESLKEFNLRKVESEKINYQKQIEQERLEQVKLEENLKKTIYENKSLIKGLETTKALQDQVYKSINEIVGKSPDGVFENKFMKERRENPLDFEVRMYHFYELTNGFTDYSKLTSKAKSSAVKDLENIARKTKFQDNGTPAWVQDENSYSNFSGHVLNV